MSWLRTYTHEGAAQIRVCFDGFQVEPYYDYVEIRDASERIVQVLMGDLGESASFCSAWVEGATVKVRFFTDASVVSRGFRVYCVESKRAHPVEARFPGQWLERETVVKDAATQATVYEGLHNNWHRFYDPETARYITPDPLGLMAGMNPFAYVDGDPVNMIDPFGLMPIKNKDGMDDINNQLQQNLRGFVPVVPLLSGYRLILGFFIGRSFQNLKSFTKKDWGSCEKSTIDFLKANNGWLRKPWSLARDGIGNSANHAWAVEKSTGTVVDRTIGDALRFYKGEKFRPYWDRVVFTPQEHRTILRFVMRRFRGAKPKHRRKMHYNNRPSDYL